MTAERSASRRAAPLDATVAILAGILALAIYIRSLAPGLLWGDSAEFQVAAWLGGFAHPTGYPLYLMLGWLWTHLVPLRDPAFRMNLFSAVCGGVAVGLFCLLVMRVLRFVAEGTFRANAGRSYGAVVRLIALGAALVFTFTPTFWSQAVIAEVYTLHAAFVAGLLLALLSWGERWLAGERSGRQAYLVALLFGLSLTHHRSTILLMPAAALFVAVLILGKRRPARLTPRRLLTLSICLLAPLLLYLYIPLRAPHAAYSRLPLGPGESLTLYDASVRGFIAHVSGSVFGASLAAPHAGLDMAALASRFVDEFSLNGVLLGLLGLVALVFFAVRERSRRASAVLALTGVFWLTQVAFNLFYAIGDIYVFYIPAYLVWALWMAVGAWALIRLSGWFFSEAGEGVRRGAAIAGGILTFVVLGAFAYRSAVIYWPKVQRAADDSARRAWDALLKSDVPQDAILVSNDRDEMVPFFYLTYVEGRRPDLTPLFPLIQPGAQWANVARVTDAALQTGRPVYLVKPMPGLEIKYDLSPGSGSSVGPLGPPVKVQARTMGPPQHAANIVYGDALRLAGYDLALQEAVAGSPLRVTLYWEPLKELTTDWTTFIQVIGSTGDKLGQSDHRPGGEFYPSTMWQVGERVADSHDIALQSGAAVGRYQLMVGLYVQEDGSLWRLGEPQAVGEVSLTR